MKYTIDLKVHKYYEVPVDAENAEDAESKAWDELAGNEEKYLIPRHCESFVLMSNKEES